MRSEPEVEVRPKVVVIGGGTGLSVMLRGLKRQPIDITAIVTVADDGGSSGILRAELDMPPPGDLRNVMVALATSEPLLKQVLQHRFQSVPGLIGHSLGNLILAALTEITGDFVKAVKEFGRVLAIRGNVLPAARQAIVLSAELTDGTVVVGESQIPHIAALMNQSISRVMISPADVSALEEAVEAIREAEAIIVGPGSLFTSIIPNLLVPDIAAEMKASKAIKLFVCNVMTQPGETIGFSVSDHLRAIIQHMGVQFFDYVIANDGKISQEVIDQYAAQGAMPVEVDRGLVEEFGVTFITDSLIHRERYLRHDAVRLSEWIMRIIRGDV